MDNNCFNTIPDTCVTFTGSLKDVPAGASLSDMFNYLINRISALETQLEICNCEYVLLGGEDKVDMGGFNENYSTCSAKLTDTNFMFNTVPGANSTSVSFDFSNIINNLPQDFTVNRKELKVYGQGSSNSLYISTNKNAGAFSLSPNKFPLSMDATIVLGTPCGTINLEKTVLVNADASGQNNALLYIKDYTSPKESAVSQAEFNTVLKDRVLLNERMLENTKLPNVTGTSKVNLKQGAPIEEVLQTLINEVDSLKQ